MQLDESFFENIDIECVRGKFYKKQDVDMLLKEIEGKAAVDRKDKEILNLKLENIERKIAKIGDADETARELAQSIIKETNEEADKILSSASAAAESILEKAKQEAADIISEAESKRGAIIDVANKKKEEFSAKLSQAWQSFLAEQETTAEENALLKENLSPGTVTGRDNQLSWVDAPEDMGDILEKIAKTITDIDSEEI